MQVKILMGVVLGLLSTLALAESKAPAGLSSPAPDGAEVYLISPADGAQVESPFIVRFGLKGMGVVPAGIEYSQGGHHHLLINVDQLPETGKPIPADDKYRHFGKGQTETTLDLPPGQHTLQLLLGNHLHVPHEPPVASKKITITVVE